MTNMTGNSQEISRTHGGLPQSHDLIPLHSIVLYQARRYMLNIARIDAIVDVLPTSWAFVVAEP